MALVRSFLGQRRQRMIATLMGYIEKEVNPQLDERQRRQLRSKVLAAANEYHDSAVDIVAAAADDGSTVNDEALRLIARVDTELTRRRREENAGARAAD